MTDSTLTTILTSLLFQSPFILVAWIGMIVIAVRYRALGNGAIFSLIGAILLAVMSIAGPLISAALPILLLKQNPAAVLPVVSVVGAAQSSAKAIGLGLVYLGLLRRRASSPV